MSNITNEQAKENQKANTINIFESLLRLRMSEYKELCIANSKMPTFLGFSDWMDSRNE